MKKQKAEKQNKFTEKVKFIILAVFTLAILGGTGVLFWQIQKQNRQAQPDYYSKANELESQVADLNSKIDGLNKSLKEANKEVKTETKVEVKQTGGGQVAGASTSKNESAAEQSGLVNINSASLDELDTLSGIGPAYAQRIIDYREANGGFKSIEEIQNVKGIGPKTFEKMKDRITV